MGQIEEFGAYLKKKLVSEDVNHRWAICQTCPELTPNNRCKQCGCFMKLKTKVKAAKCPIGKW
jgi:DNA gyrase inhibitor GyrI